MNTAVCILIFVVGWLGFREALPGPENLTERCVSLIVLGLILCADVIAEGVKERK